MVTTMDPKTVDAQRKRMCGHCGRPASDHKLVNFADGPQVGESVLVCPTCTFDGGVEVVQPGKAT